MTDTTYGPGDTLPDIALETIDGSEVKPSDFKGRKLVLFFYPKDNTPGCTTEAKDFSALRPDFDAAGVALLGVSKDSAQKHRNFIAKHDLTVDLATDAQDGGLSDALGVWTGKSYDEAKGDIETGEGVATIRVIRPDQPVTQDFRPDRLNVELDAEDNVTRIYCG